MTATEHSDTDISLFILTTYSMEKRLFSRWLALPAIIIAIIVMVSLNARAMMPILPYGQITKSPWTAKVYYIEDPGAPAPEGWTDPDFDDSAWENFEGPISNGDMYYGNSVATGKYYIRRSFTLTEISELPYVIYNKNYTSRYVYINGERIYVNYPYSLISLSSLRIGKNVLSSVSEVSSDYSYYDSGLYETSITVNPTSEINNVDYTIETDSSYPWIQIGDSTICPVDPIEGAQYPITFSFTLTNHGQVQIETHSLPKLELIIDGERVDWGSYSYSTGNGVTYILGFGPGSHTVTLIATNKDSEIYRFDVLDYRDWIEVEATPDGLAADVLGQVSSINDVRCIKVTGQMNDLCFYHLSQMPNLCAVDLSGAISETIPPHTFNKYQLTSILLPSGLKSIGEYAFCNTAFHAIDLPESLISIGEFAFLRSSLKEIVIPDSVSSIGPGGFANCERLISVTLPKELETISNTCFSYCRSLTTIQLPNTLKEIEHEAFSDSGLASILIPKSVNVIGGAAFIFTKIKEIILPPYNKESYNLTFAHCDSLKIVTFTSFCIPEQSAMFSYVPEGLTLVVPPVSLSNYRNASYFNRFTVEAGDETDYWVIFKNATLDETQRPSVKPDVELLDFELIDGWGIVREVQGHLTVNGAAPLALGNVTLPVTDPSRYPENNGYTSPTVINNCSSMTSDSLIQKYNFTESNRWYFFTPMADVRVTEIKVEYGGEGETPDNLDYVIRYYDSEYRAANGNDGSRDTWKNVSEPTLKAGQGYIFQATHNARLILPSATPAAVNAFSEKAVTVPLKGYPSEYTYDKNWNHVGNPYASFFDIIHMDYTSPITVWNHTYQNYTAYTTTDDEFALRPGQSFFVQAPDEVSSITFAPEGRQQTGEINHANGVRQLNAENGYSRFVIDLQLTDGESMDKTRLVLNEESSLEYEFNRDAPKFRSMTDGVPQMYTIDENRRRLSINERPVADGECILGVYLPSASKEYSIKTTRAQSPVYLYDRETGAEAYIGGDNEYLFTASRAGAVNDRFLLRVAPTSMETLKEAQTKVIAGDGYITVTADKGSKVVVTGIDGIVHYRGGSGTVKVQRGIYVVTVNGKNHKVAVR